MGLTAEGYTDSACGPLSSVALDSGCADGELFSRSTGSVLLLGTPMVATGLDPGVGPRVGPGVGPGVDNQTALWRVPRTSSRGCQSLDLGSAPTGSGIKPLFSRRPLPDFDDAESELLEEEELAPDWIRGNGLAPIGNGLAVSESIDPLLLSVCLLISRIAEVAPKPLLWVATVILKPTRQRAISWLS